MKIIDTHAHFRDGMSILNSNPVSIEQMIEIMDAHDIEQCWASSTTALDRDNEEANKRQWIESQKFPGRMVNFYVVDPNYPEHLEDCIRRAVEDWGFRGLKLHPWETGFPVDNSETEMIMNLAVEYDIPMLFHDGTPPWSESLQIAALADLYPKAKIILGHSGLFDAYRSAIEACNTHENIWLDICGPCVGDAREIIQKAKADRILYGSDFAYNETDKLVAERIKVIEYACPDEEMRNKIFYENARKLIP